MCRIEKGIKIHPVVKSLLKTTSINLANGGGIPELIRFQEHFTNIRNWFMTVYIVIAYYLKNRWGPLNVLIYYLMTSTDTIT